jgi:uncharacterized membrane protein
MQFPGNALSTRRPRQARSRAIVKTVLYRVLMVAVTIVVAYVFTGDAGVAVNVGIAANVVKTLTYYGYERAWDRVQWGRS